MRRPFLPLASTISQNEERQTIEEVEASQLRTDCPTKPPLQVVRWGGEWVLAEQQNCSLQRPEPMLLEQTAEPAPRKD